MAWPFAEVENAASFVCRCVYDRKKPLLSVKHDEDGEWQFLCGKTHIDPKPVLICLGCMLVREPSLREVAALPRGKWADRSSPTAAWEW